MSHPSFEEFHAALADPSRRPMIGLVITDDEAWSLLENEEWAREYFAEWQSLAPSGQQADVAEPDAPAPVKRATLPRWALAAIVGGAAIVLLAAAGVGTLVYTGVIATGDDDQSAADPTPKPMTPAKALLPWDEGFEAPYSDDDAAAYLAIVEPLFASETSGSIDQSQSYLLFGSSACVSLAAGFAEAEVIDPMVQASGGKLTAEEGQTMIDAAKTYLCE